jgi:spore coat polysaccharide biosynthesis protein SpsF (cytidylyltransferase family)
MNTDEKIPSLVTVRSTSSRLPGKCFLSFGEVSVLEHVVLRARHYGLYPIICTTRDPEDDSIIELAERIGVEYYRGPTKNKLLRWSECCDHFGLSAFHSVDADDPFFDGDEVRRSMRLLLEGGYDMVCPTESSAAGGASVGYSLTAEIVKRVSAVTDDETDTEMMWYHIEKISNLKKMVLPEIQSVPFKVRLTLDYEEDYWLLESVRRISGNLASRDEISHLFSRNPDLYKINWFRNEAWMKGQLSKRI